MASFFLALAKKELGQYPAILTEQAWSITHIYNARDLSAKNTKQLNATQNICTAYWRKTAEDELN